MPRGFVHLARNMPDCPECRTGRPVIEEKPVPALLVCRCQHCSHRYYVEFNPAWADDEPARPAKKRRAMNVLVPAKRRKDAGVKKGRRGPYRKKSQPAAFAA